MPTFNYWSVSPRELALMTRERVSMCIDYELMEKGVIKVEQPAMRPIVPVTIETKPYYMVKTNSYNELCCFETMPEAEAMLGLHPVKRNYSYDCGAKVYYADNEDLALTIEIVQLASKADYMNAVKTMKENKAAEEANAKAQAEFATDAKSMDEVTNGLFDDWMHQQEVESKNQRILGIWKSYLKMSENDRRIATNFINRVFQPDEVKGAVEWLGEAWDAPLPEVEGLDLTNTPMCADDVREMIDTGCPVIPDDQPAVRPCTDLDPMDIDF
jgi:hypothetical protein